MFMYKGGVKLGTISKALEHKNLTATILYLGIEEQVPQATLSTRWMSTQNPFPWNTIIIKW